MPQYRNNKLLWTKCNLCQSVETTKWALAHLVLDKLCFLERLNDHKKNFLYQIKSLLNLYHILPLLNMCSDFIKIGSFTGIYRVVGVWIVNSINSKGRGKGCLPSCDQYQQPHKKVLRFQYDNAGGKSIAFQSSPESTSSPLSACLPCRLGLMIQILLVFN